LAIDFATSIKIKENQVRNNPRPITKNVAADFGKISFGCSFPQIKDNTSKAQEIRQNIKI
jgi:hypothetical protein